MVQDLSWLPNPHSSSKQSTTVPSLEPDKADHQTCKRCHQSSKWRALGRVGLPQPHHRKIQCRGESQVLRLTPRSYLSIDWHSARSYNLERRRLAVGERALRRIAHSSVLVTLQNLPITIYMSL
jgi:hypothetical protein